MVPILVGVILAAGSVTATVRLQDREQSAHAAEIRVANVRSTLITAQVLPWNLGHLPPPTAHAQLLQSEREIVRELASIRRASPSAALAHAEVSLQHDTAVLADIERYTARGGSSREATILAAREFEVLQSVVAELQSAEAGYAGAAHTARTEATIGSSLAVVTLLAAFVFFNRRSVRAARELRGALHRLGLAQEERMRLLARTVEAADTERRRIAADLHDGPIQRLTATVFTVDQLVGRLARGAAGVEQIAAQLRSQLEQQIQSLRSLMVELRPPVLDERGLAAAIGDMAAEAAPVDCSVHDGTAGTRPAPEIETIAHSVAREAILNIHKHARAAHAWIEIERRDDQLRLRIADDGVGFADSDVAAQRDHVGLTTMRERIASVGGTLAIRSRQGGGTIVEAALPWQTARLAAAVTRPA